MSGHPLDDACAWVREVAPEVALGLLTGEARAEALAHLERCEACRAEVAALAQVADEVLLAAPEAAPPPGFADRVLARLATEAAAETGEREISVAGAAGRNPDTAADPSGRGLSAVRPAAAGPSSSGAAAARRGPGRRRVIVGMAVAAVAVLLAGVALVGVGRDPSPDGDDVVAAEMRTGRGRTVGEVVLTGDRPVEVTLDMPEWDDLVERWEDEAAGDYWLAVETRDGGRTLWPMSGDGAGDGSGDGGAGTGWTVTVDADRAEVATVSVVDEGGRTWCSGTFPA